MIQRHYGRTIVRMDALFEELAAAEPVRHRITEYLYCPTFYRPEPERRCVGPPDDGGKGGSQCRGFFLDSFLNRAFLNCSLLDYDECFDFILVVPGAHWNFDESPAWKVLCTRTEAASKSPVRPYDGPVFRHHRNGNGQGGGNLTIVAELRLQQREQACDILGRPLAEVRALHHILSLGIQLEKVQRTSSTPVIVPLY